MTGPAAQKKQLLADEIALNQTETAAILGCRPREVGDHMAPSFYRGSKPKYVFREVIKVRDRMIDAANRLRTRNIRMVQGV